MKKSLLFGIFMIMSFALLAQERTPAHNASGAAQRETHVTPAQALNVGYTFMRTGDGSKGNGTKSGSMSKQAMQLIYTGQATDSLTGAVTDCYYVFALQPKGFVIVAADDRVEPILGYSYDNDFMVRNMPDHVRGWLGNYERQIETVVKQNIAPETETTTKWSQLKSGQAVSTRNRNTVGPLLTTQWDQEWPYNALCPNDGQGNFTLTGCIATMMAQLMKYWDWPKRGTGFTSYQTWQFGEISADFENTEYNWDNMPDFLDSLNTDVALLLYHCGIAVNMEYGFNESSTYPSRVQEALTSNFQYSHKLSWNWLDGSSDYIRESIRHQLDMYQPVHYSASNHSYIVDGYQNEMFHFNMGWGGYYDGYYMICPNEENAFYQNAPSATINIRPDKPIYMLHALNIDTFSTTLVTSTQTEEIFTTSDYLVWLNDQLPPITVPAIETSFDANEPILYTSSLHGLRPNTTYTFCVKLSNEYYQFTDDTLHFSTVDIDDLSAYPPLIFYDTVYVCSGKTWKGRTVPGDYSDTVLFNNSPSINYIIHSHLIINNEIPNITVSDSVITSCSGEQILMVASGASQYTWDNGLLPKDSVFVIADHDTIFRVIGETNGCLSYDSVIVSVLAVNKNKQVITMLPNDTIIFGNFVITEPGIYYDSVPSVNGCYDINELIVKKPLFSGGNGSVESPFLILCKEDLEIMADAIINDNSWDIGKHFLVVQDILDTVRSPLGIFRGFFHGGGHKIVLGIRSFQPNPLGLFIKIDEGASVDSVILEGYVIGSDNSGGIAVSNDGLITHCVNKANIMGVGGCGGIAATSELGEISYCSNAGSIRGGDGVGGICGSVISSNQTHHCSNIGNVYASRQGACGVGPSYYSINAGIVASEFSDAGAGGTYSIEVGPNLFIPSGVRFYYDNQICRSSQPDIADNIEGKHGEALIDNGLSSIFANRFVYNSGMYPIPKGMENDSITVLAATPVIFEKTDNRLSIKHPFFVHNGNGVSWSSKLGKVRFLNNGKVIQNTLGEDTLIAQYGSFRKSIPIDIACIPTEDSLFYSDCSSVTYNGLVFYHDTIFNDSVENQLGEIDFKTILIEILSKKTIIEVPLSQNENYNFHGTTLTESGIYTDTLQTVSGCDSIVILNLTFNLSPYSGGNGTFISPYIIANLSDFQQLIDNIHTFGEDYSSGKYFLQTSNITDSVRNTLPTFKGYYDGDGHSIRIAISNGGSLFGTVYGSIHNLTLYGYYYAPPYDHVGCFASYLYGNITNCVNYCDIIGTCESGGIASWLYDYSRIERCSNYGSITGYVAGGIAAQSMFRAVVTECANSGVISSSNYKAGGIVGINNAGATVSKCINTGTIYGNVMSGGIVAENTGVINHCFNSGLITGPQINGGISATHGTMLDASTTGGYVEGWPVNINGCINVGNISSSNSFGSICGIVDNHDTTNLSYNYYDCQWSHAKGFNNSDVFGRAEPMHTHEMINGNISGLFDTCWTFMTNKYPLLKDLYLDSICQVAAMPVLLDASNKSDSITLPFLILGTSECSYSSMYDKVLLDGETGLGTLLFSGQDTLVLQYGNNKKTLPINITNIPAIASTHVWTGCDSVLVDNKCFYGDSIWSTVDTSNNNNNNNNNNINIVVTNIVLLKSFISETSVAINEGDSVFFRGRFLHNAGIYYDSLVSTIGCDSIYKITVSVNKKRIIYVKESGTGDGSSWVDAFGDIQLAVNIAEEIGGMVWIAAGTYTGCGITVPDGVAIYGGFYGNEPETYNISKRNLATNISIITGQAISIGNGSLIDGFTIKDIYSEKCINGGQLYNCRITECRCTTPYSGWGVVCDSYLFNCLLDRNHNSILYRCSAFNCTFANNTSDTYMMYDASLTNCINWNNSGRHYGCVVSFSAIDKNITLDGIGVVVLDDEDDGINPTSNYVRFMDPYNGDYRLSAGSVCINTGDPNVEAFGLPSTDLQGWPRVLLGRIDIGAFEYYPIPMMETYDTICEGNSVVFFDSTCTAEGSYVHHTHAEDVTLDTLYVLHLTVNQSTYGDTTAVACDSFTWQGTTHTESGSYLSYLTNAAGCDSIVTLHLTINPYDTITLAVNDTLMGSVALAGALPEGATVLGNGSYRVPRGSEISVKAVFDAADFGFLFWTNGNDTLSVDSVYTFTVTGSSEYTAHIEYLPTPYFYVSKTGWATWINPHSGPGAFIRVEVKAADSDQWETLHYSSSITSAQLPLYMLIDSTLYTVRAVLHNYEPSFESREVTFDWFYVACDHFEGVSNFVGELTDQGVALSWDAGEGPQQYLLYRNYLIIDTLTTTNYLDTSGVYSNKYYVSRVFGGSAVCPYNNDSLSMSCQIAAKVYVDLTLTTDPPMFGTAAFVLPDNTGHVAIGGTCTVSATANEGYSFTHWTFNGTKVSVQSTYTFDVEQVGEVVAHFEYAPATDLYVSRTGWATWNNPHGQPGDNSCVSTQVTLKRLDGQVLFTQTFPQSSANHCQLPTSNLADSTLYLMSVVLTDTAGNSSEASIQWYYVACDHLSGFTSAAGTFSQQGVNLNWDYPSNMAFTTATVDFDFFNGFVTDTAVMSDGGDASWAIEPQSTAGPYCNYASNTWVGDRITLSDTTRIYEMEVYAFQSDFSTTSPFTGLYIQIYQGNPEDSVLVWGSADSNLMTATAFTGCYRGSASNPMMFNLRRPIMSLTASGLDIELAPGTYYLVWSTSVSNTINPVAIPHCKPVVGNTGDYGMLFTESRGWRTMHDGGSGESFGFAFHLTGEQVLSPVVEPESAAIYRDGELIDTTSATTYMDPEGSADHSYEIRVVYGGDRHCVYGNAAMSMSCLQPVSLHCGETFTGDTTAVACESFSWQGITYTESGDYTYYTTTATGCDSVVILHLTIYQNEITDFTVTCQDSCYTWNDQVYCNSGDYNQTLQTVYGCDSVVTLHLTITVGVDDYEIVDFKVYPNPTNNFVNVQCTMNNGEVGLVEFQLFDAFGKLVNITNVGVFGTQGVCDTPPQTDAHGSSVQTQINLSHYAAGVYFVKAVADGNVVAVRKVVKR